MNQILFALTFLVASYAISLFILLAEICQGWFFFVQQIKIDVSQSPTCSFCFASILESNLSSSMSQMAGQTEAR